MAGSRGKQLAAADTERTFPYRPAVLEESVTINAGIEKVWKMFIDLSSWRGWNTVLTVVCPSEKRPIAEGESFFCLLSPYAFAVKLEPLAIEVLPCRKIVLAGNKFGISARHEFLFEGNEEETLVTSRETFRGMLLVFPGWTFVKRKLKRLTRAMLYDLKNAAEKFTLEQTRNVSARGTNRYK